MRLKERTTRIVLLRLLLLSVLLAPLHETFGEEDWPEPIEDNPIIFLLLFDQLEYRTNDGSGALNWDAEGRIGGDYNRIWLKTEGEQNLSDDGGGEAELQLLYSRLISPYFDVQAGFRHDEIYGAGSDRSRNFGVISIQGLGIYWFELEFTAFVSEDGDFSARLTGEYDFLLTQRLVLQPRLETEVALQEVEEFGVGKGFNDIELGLRLRYEILREFAPYIGISWETKLGETADLARREGDDIDSFSVVLGVRMWF
jgi:copper resistance protein B